MSRALPSEFSTALAVSSRGDWPAPPWIPIANRFFPLFSCPIAGMQETPVVNTADAKKLRRPTSSLNISFLPAAAREGRHRNENEQKVTKEAKKGKKRRRGFAFSALAGSVPKR